MTDQQPTKPTNPQDIAITNQTKLYELCKEKVGDRHSHKMKKNQITFLIPKHVSAQPPSSAYILPVHRAGIVWHELAPIFLRAPSSFSKRLLALMILSSPTKISSKKQQKGDENDEKDVEQELFPGYRYRQLSSRKLPSIVVYAAPPSISSPDYIFLSVVLRTEHYMLQLQTLSAWLSTIGGGYFFCKRLSVSLRLARQQRVLAVRLGNVAMVRQCTINEAYNLIYSGKFVEAKKVLTALEKNLEGDDDKVTWRQCQAARLFAKRLKQVTKSGVLEPYHPKDKKENHIIDDFQRIRIVEE
jgi:hypothetical protein